MDIPVKEPVVAQLSTPSALDCELTAEYFENILYIILPFIALYLHIVPEISLKLFPTLKMESPEKLNNLVSDCISTIPSGLTSFITIRAFIYYVPSGDEDSMFNCFRWCSILMSAYLILDTVYRYFCIKTNMKVMVVHHLIGIVITQTAMYDRAYLLAKLIFCLMEVPNPFINLRLMMLAVGCPRTSLRYKAVALCMMVTFGAFRILPIPYMLKVALFAHLYDDIGWAHSTMCLLYVVLSCMNVYWFIKMVKLSKKVVRGECTPDH